MDILEAALENLVTYVAQLASKEVQLLPNVRSEVDSMMEELRSMNAFLESASQRKDNDPWIKNWAREVSTLAHDAADCIDYFILSSPKKPQETFGKFFGSLTNAKSKHKTGTTIQDIKKRITEASDRAKRYHIEGAASSGSRATQVDLPGIAAYVEDHEDLVGIDEPRELLRSRLVEGKETRLSVVSVVGMAGLGKTAVVQRVFNDPKVRKTFGCRAWVHVGESWETKSRLRLMGCDFFPSGSNPERSGMDVDQLIRQLRDRLKDKRYVVVFDNMWDLEAWNIINCALPNDQNGSRVIVTTQIEKVGQSCSVNHRPVFVYKLPFLTRDSARQLFCKIVFDSPDHERCPKGLGEHMNDILENCEGLPRAIVTVGQVLANNKSKTDWKNLHKHLGASDADPALRRMTGILTNCYDNLPYHLRDCFLYLSIFPKNSKIRRNRLVRRFTAEGLVRSGNGKLAAEVAEEYFDEFISRNITQPLDDIGADGKVKTCRIHFLLHAIIVSMSARQKFACPLSERYKTTLGDGKVWHLSVHDGAGQQPRPHLSRVRSLTMSKYNKHLLATSDVLATWGSVVHLRVLDLEGCESLEDADLKYVCKFHLLRYLSLRKTGITKLTEDIGKLRYLQTLDIKDTQVTEMPACINKMEQLTYLLAGKSGEHKKKGGVKLPEGIGNVKTLVVLAQVDANQSLTELGELTELRKLGLIGLKQESGGELSAVLQKLDDSLRSLSLWNSDYTESLDYLVSLPSPPQKLESLKLGGRLDKLPEWIAKLSHVVKMTLRGTRLKYGCMLALQNLVSLVQLILMDDAYVGKNLRIRGDGFPSLKELHVENLTKLERLEISEGAALNLEKLYIWGSNEVDLNDLKNRRPKLVIDQPESSSSSGQKRKSAKPTRRSSRKRTRITPIH